MARFDLAVVKTLIHEGGSLFVNDPTDRGGATKYGISQRAYPDLDIRNLTEQQARDIYRRDYWDRVRADDIVSQAVAASIFDTAVNMGARTASRLAQVSAGVEPVDGVIGSQSLRTINDANESLFLASYAIVKIARYARICTQDKSQKKYLLGWLNRVLGATQ